MRYPVLLAYAAAGLSILVLSKGAGAQQLGGPHVISGIGPQQAAPAPVSAGRYGGGLFEALFGDAGPSGAVYNAPQPAAQPQRGAYVAYYAPDAAAPQSVARTIDPRYARQEVDYQGGKPAGTIVIDTPNKFLYLVLGHGRALRYGIGVGRPGFEWSGVKTISRKAEWPAWTPPPEMLLRRPDLPRHMEGGPGNPLGSRAMYLGSSLYRIHGTNEPETIGTNVSSGCIRMLNADVMDLYDRVRVGTRVIIL